MRRRRPMQWSDLHHRRREAAQGGGGSCCATCGSMWIASKASRRTKTTALRYGGGEKGVGRACHTALRWEGRGHPGYWMALGASEREEAREGARGEAWGCQKPRHANQYEPQGKLPGPQRLRKSLFGFGEVGRMELGEGGRRGQPGRAQWRTCVVPHSVCQSEREPSWSFAPARWGWGSSAGTPPAFPRTPVVAVAGRHTSWVCCCPCGRVGVVGGRHGGGGGAVVAVHPMGWDAPEWREAPAGGCLFPSLLFGYWLGTKTPPASGVVECGPAISSARC